MQNSSEFHAAVSSPFPLYHVTEIRIPPPCGLVPEEFPFNVSGMKNMKHDVCFISFNETEYFYKFNNDGNIFALC